MFDGVVCSTTIVCPYINDLLLHATLILKSHNFTEQRSYKPTPNNTNKMAPTILVVGATGNTGTGVVEHLLGLLKNNKALSQHRILALTRSKNSETAQRLATLPGVNLVEQNWTEINSQ